MSDWKIWTHIQNWKTVYIFMPVAFFLIWLFSKGAYLITGRKPQENVDWIVGVAGNSVKLVILIVFCELIRESTGTWHTKEELIAHPEIGWRQDFAKCVYLIVGAYILSH